MIFIILTLIIALSLITGFLLGSTVTMNKCNEIKNKNARRDTIERIIRNRNANRNASIRNDS